MSLSDYDTVFISKVPSEEVRRSLYAAYEAEMAKGVQKCGRFDDLWRTTHLFVPL